MAKKPSRAKRRQLSAQKSAPKKPLTTIAIHETAEEKKTVHLSSGWSITKLAVQVLYRHWLFFLGLAVILALLNFIFVHNVGDVTSLKGQVANLFGNGGHSATTGLATYTLLLSDSFGGVTGSASVYQYIFLIIGSLAIIWSLRQLVAEAPAERVRVRDAFYKGMYPLVPFVLILVVLLVELLPLLAGASIYSTVLSTGAASSAIERVGWLIVLLGGLAASLWLLTISMFSLYIVTLPDMAPVAALRSARRIVKGYELSVIRKLLFLIITLLIVSSLLMLPVILFASAVAGIFYFVLGLIALLLTHSYLYTLYRELLA